MPFTSTETIRLRCVNPPEKRNGKHCIKLTIHQQNSLQKFAIRFMFQFLFIYLFRLFQENWFVFYSLSQQK